MPESLIAEINVAQASYDRLTVLHDFHLEVPTGKAVAVLGANGAGKTTALAATIGAVATTERRFVFENQLITKVAPWNLPRRGVVLVPDGARCFPSLTVEENLRAPAFATGIKGAELRGRIQEVVSIFPVLAERRRQPAGTLSGGERQMLALGRALMAQPRLMLLDEPSAGLAPKVAQEVFGALRRIRARGGMSLVIAEQNVGLAAVVAEEGVIIEQGRITASGSLDHLAQHQAFARAYLGE